jgi:Pentapeptide repeats (9 copies)
MVDGLSERGDDDTAKAHERRRLVRRLAVVGAGVLVLLVLLVLVVVVLPPRFTAHRTFDKDHEELKAQNDVRTTLLQGLGAMLVLTGAAIGASVAYRGVQETRRQIAQTAADNQEQFTLTRQGQVTDRYTKAVEQLGHLKAPVRLGALYSLEHLAQDNPNYRQTIVDVVCAYLRMPYTLPAQPEPDAAQVQEMAPPANGQDRAPHSAPGRDPAQEELQVRQTAQRLLADHLRRPRGAPQDDQLRPSSPRLPFWPGISLDLTGATLIDFGFARVSVINARFGRATFQGEAVFRGANFQGSAVFDETSFQGDAAFGGANFQGNAAFRGTSFQGNAWFRGTSFQGNAWFRGANFQGDAWFKEATFQGDARFIVATFQGDAWFEKATFNGDAKFIEATFHGDAWFTEANFHGDVEFREANFHGNVGFRAGATFHGSAEFGGVIFQIDAGFEEATFHGAALFMAATFHGGALFIEATFQGDAWFMAATFHGAAWFDGATFHGGTLFSEATFHGAAGFDKATFHDDARFGEALALSFDDPNMDRVWPDGWTVHPDPTDPSRGTLVFSETPPRETP